ncbi:uncharacterized protein HaLaN_07813, partial [Haematococcus lacustris]
MQHHRPSILHRPCKGASQTTVETADAQHDREQAAALEDQQSYLQKHLQAKTAEREVEAQLENLWNKPSNGTTNAHHKLPWQNPSMIYNSAVEEKLARRHFEEQAAAENRALAAGKAAVQDREASVEAALARTALAEQNYWNRGAQPGDRFQPSDLRRRPGRDDQDRQGVPVSQACPFAQDHSSGSAAGGSAPVQKPHAQADKIGRYQYQRPASGAPFATNMPDQEHKHGMHSAQHHVHVHSTGTAVASAVMTPSGVRSTSAAARPLSATSRPPPAHQQLQTPCWAPAVSGACQPVQRSGAAPMAPVAPYAVSSTQ